jgi:hypothetical protein
MKTLCTPFCDTTLDNDELYTKGVTKNFPFLSNDDDHYHDTKTLTWTMVNFIDS